VFKKRGSTHERTIRSYTLSSTGIRVGDVLRGFRGLLTGVPVPLLDPRAEGAGL
jgi:circadian clock protein KaiC